MRLRFDDWTREQITETTKEIFLLVLTCIRILPILGRIFEFQRTVDDVNSNVLCDYGMDGGVAGNANGIFQGCSIFTGANCSIWRLKNPGKKTGGPHIVY